MKTALRTVAIALLAVFSASAALAAPPAGKGGGRANNSKFATSCQTSPVAPTISGTPSTSTTEGIAYSFTPSASDANCDPLTFSIDGKPAWATFDTRTGRLSGTPPAGTAGLYPYIVISVSDGYSAALLPAFSISVKPNTAPLISGSPPTQVFDGQVYRFRPSASDPDGHTLRFSVSNKPAWATLNTSTGELSGTPSPEHVGLTRSVTISVSDGMTVAKLAPFDIEVLPSNDPPSISGSAPTSVTVGNTYSFTPTAQDPDGDALSFSISNLPRWATFDTATGRLSGTPASAEVGTYSNIAISVSDGKLTASLAPFSVTVVAANSAPKISGTPPTSVVAGSSYLFRPSATDADGDTLRFAISNLPAWARFDTASGQLSGTPGAADVGTYANIVISVSDGQLTASLPAFSIAVQQVSTGSVTLSWQPPDRRTDGSALTNLAGYRIRYGTTAGSYPYVVTLANPGLTSHVIENLPAGTYYFVMTAYDSAGIESAATNPVSKSVN